MKGFWLPPKLRQITIGPLIVKGHYVYEWLDHGKVFYVGMGTNRRAWNTHNSLAESIRFSSTCFRVRIINHCMSKQLAHAVERSHTHRLTSLGFFLANERIPQTTSPYFKPIPTKYI